MDKKHGKTSVTKHHIVKNNKDYIFLNINILEVYCELKKHVIVQSLIVYANTVQKV